jgi:hypothetical protein
MAVMASNSALDRSFRPVTPVAAGQRARQSVPPVSASVRQLRSWLWFVTVAALLGGMFAGCQNRSSPAAIQAAGHPLGTIQDECSVWCDLLGYTEAYAREAKLADVTAGPRQDKPTLERTLAALPAAFRRAGMPVPERRTLQDFLLKSSTPVAIRLDCCGRASPKPLSRPLPGRPSAEHYISRVGFNGKMDQALVYETLAYGNGFGGSGREWWALFEKVSGRWRLKGAVVAIDWIS